MQKNHVIVEDFHETLSEIRVDNFHFRITWNPLDMESCIVWFQDEFVSDSYEALGKFSAFDKRVLLNFITKFCTTPELREEIALRKFERRLGTFTPAYFENLENLPHEAKIQAYRNLYNLDSVFDRCDIEKKRRLMARKFHPDRGGDSRSMMIINEAYDFLVAEEQ